MIVESVKFGGRLINNGEQLIYTGNGRYHMTFNIVDRQWHREFIGLRQEAQQRALLMTPFITKTAIDDILGSTSKEVKVITRFNLADFALGVSEISALSHLLSIGADVRGIKRLHSKVYILGGKAIVTSANLTKAALSRNCECGVISKDITFLQAVESYFNDLWSRGKPLTTNMLLDWTNIINNYRQQGMHANRPNLPDFGSDVGFGKNDNDIHRFHKFMIDGTASRICRYVRITDYQRNFNRRFVKKIFFSQPMIT